jgi:hypothetical protein
VGPQRQRQHAFPPVSLILSQGALHCLRTEAAAAAAVLLQQLLQRAGKNHAILPVRMSSIVAVSARGEACSAAPACCGRGLQ